MNILSWNIEGAKRGAHNLAHFVEKYDPALMFLSEPQVFQCDAALAMAPLLPTYCYHLNSEDTYYPELALDKRQAHGGTLALWHSALDPFITILPTTSPAVLPLLLSVPGITPSVHVGIYLPTSGRDEDFVVALASLTAVLEHVLEDHHDVPVYVRGDANVNPSNLPRVQLFSSILSQFSLKNLPLLHPTHHHFTGDGDSDSQLDVLLFRGVPEQAESLLSVVCGKENPLISSHHDLVVSTFLSSRLPYSPPPPAVTAPRVPNTRVKVFWDQEGQQQYETLLSSTLPLLKHSLLNPASPSLTTILLDCTNFAINRAAEISFKTTQLSKPPSKKKQPINPDIRQAQADAIRAAQDLRAAQSSPSSSPLTIQAAISAKSSSTSALRAVVRSTQRQEARQRDTLLHSVLSSDPSKLQAAVKKAKCIGTPAVHLLQVGKHSYTGDSVPDGFYEALLNLKVPEISPSSSAQFLSTSENYRNIIELAKSGPPLPSLSIPDAVALLERVRPDVLDLFSISARHYLMAGAAGHEHFAALLNLIIANINLSTAAELNSAWSIMLHKGHNKPRCLSRSWRCISTCPLVPKVLDLYVADLHSDNWMSASAPTQFMTRGSSHELAALLLTEVICYATLTLGIALWVLLLDKQSAFDSVLKEHIISEAYSAAGHHADQSLLYMANRLATRRTFLEFSSTLMGPIHDQRGVEQGGVYSGDQFQLVNNEELIVTNTAGLGLNMGEISVGSIGVADDVALVSPDPHALQSLLNLSQSLTSSRCMVNVQEKTKLLLYHPKGDRSADYWQIASPIMMQGAPLPLSSQAEHVGVLRCPGGSNLASITARIASHTKSLYSVISCGMARNHRGNPAASLRVEACYSAPKLFSGLASLFLSPAEMKVLAVHRRLTLQRLQRLHPRTPAPALHFLSGSLPAPALVHKHQYTLLHMVAVLGSSNILFQHGLYVLHHNIKSSWFAQVRALSQQYSLPDPIQILISPPPKNTFKSDVRTAISSFWRDALITEAETLTSLRYMRLSFLPLGRGAHPLWWTCYSSPSAVRSATVMGKMLSGRYRSCWLRRHWTQESGACRLPGCGQVPGDVAHLLSGECPALQPHLATTLLHLFAMLAPHPHLLHPVKAALHGDREAVTMFFLDPSTDPSVIQLVQLYGQEQVLTPLFQAARAWVWCAHRARMRMLGLEHYLK